MKISVSRIKQHDVDHFEEVYKFYMPLLHRFALQYTYDSGTAKDLVHDAFLWVWNNADKIRENGNLAALLFRLVRSNCLNYLRSLGIRDRNDVKYAEAMAEIDSLLEEPGMDDLGLLRHQWLLRALKLLPKRGREALELHFVRNMHTKAIALEMSVSESTVKTHLKRALKTLRDDMDEK